MLDKNRKPLISIPQNEDYARLIFKKQEELKNNTPIIVIPEEAKELRDEVQSVANEKGVEVTIIGMGEGKKGLRNLSMNLAAISLVLATTEKQQKDRALIFEDEELGKSRVDLFQTIPMKSTDYMFLPEAENNNPIFKEKDFSKPKKERAKNNRKTKKRKKAKNGR